MKLFESRKNEDHEPVPMVSDRAASYRVGGPSTEPPKVVEQVKSQENNFDAIEMDDIQIVEAEQEKDLKQDTYKWFFIYKIVAYLLLAAVWTWFQIGLYTYGSQDIMPDQKYFRAQVGKLYKENGKVDSQQVKKDLAERYDKECLQDYRLQVTVYFYMYVVNFIATLLLLTILCYKGQSKQVFLQLKIIRIKGLNAINFVIILVMLVFKIMNLVQKYKNEEWGRDCSDISGQHENRVNFLDEWFVIISYFEALFYIYEIIADRDGQKKESADELKKQAKDIENLKAKWRKSKGILKQKIKVIESGGINCEKCMICQNLMVPNKPTDKKFVINGLPCGHQFHQECLQRQLLVRAECPVCKYAMNVRF